MLAPGRQQVIQLLFKCQLTICGQLVNPLEKLQPLLTLPFTDPPFFDIADSADKSELPLVLKLTELDGDWYLMASTMEPHKINRTPRDRLPVRLQVASHRLIVNYSVPFWHQIRH